MQKLSPDPSSTLPPRIKQGQRRDPPPSPGYCSSPGGERDWGMRASPRPWRLLEVCHLPPNPAFTPVREQGSHASNLPLASWSFFSCKEEGFRLNKRTSLNNNKESLQTSLKTGIERNKKPGLSFRFPLFCHKGMAGLVRPGSGGDPRIGPPPNGGSDSLASRMRTGPRSLLEPVQFV